MVVGNFSSDVIETYRSLISVAPPQFQGFVNLFLIVILMVIYSVIIWKLHKFIATKNIFKFDLNKYNTAEHPVLTKLIASGFYLLEYIVIIPFIIFFLFSAFNIFLIFVMELDLKVIFFISAAILATIRILAYIPKYGEDLAKEIAKLLPLNLLAITLLTPNFFNVERILGNLSRINEFSSVILNYLVFIVVLEALLRFFEFLFNIMGIEDVPKEKKEG